MMSTVWSSVQANGSWQGSTFSADIFLSTYVPKLAFKNLLLLLLLFWNSFFAQNSYCFSHTYHPKVLQWVGLNGRVSFSFDFMHPSYFLWLRKLLTISKTSTTTEVTHFSLSGGLCHVYTELRFGITGYWIITLLQIVLKLRQLIVAKKLNIFSTLCC